IVVFTLFGEYNTKFTKKMANNNEQRYQVTTEKTNTNILSPLLGGESIATTVRVRDLQTGKVHEATNYNENKAYEEAYTKAERGW
ncbi:MAG: hypothetical protein SAJ12_03940, partial [Jaaginema sp. PMC 1079.18]|nr:hypothetical protein [Jaaginema sp. PMC 1079.18]